MSSIAAIDARCFIPPAPSQAREPGDLSWAWRPAETASVEAQRRDEAPANLNSLIARHFGLAAA